MADICRRIVNYVWIKTNIDIEQMHEYCVLL